MQSKTYWRLRDIYLHGKSKKKSKVMVAMKGQLITPDRGREMVMVGKGSRAEGESCCYMALFVTFKLYIVAVLLECYVIFYNKCNFVNEKNTPKCLGPKRRKSFG